MVKLSDIWKQTSSWDPVSSIFSCRQLSGMEVLNAVLNDADKARSFACVGYHDAYPTQILRNPLFELYNNDNRRGNDQLGAKLGNGLKIEAPKKSINQ